ncbi:hypothetical protein [Limnoglobus roseus]|uniref:Uncharacterized protein n=1 Tax=Limnoglobus roseus TaxID=2598579 RepID=A0A5C1AGY0_9BACT|nr:hypothetical protein [Limnoglobus roseus]QEL17417.1 hypothetical protein PX52LOC_04406 [Limnoglobus roseus]
MRTRFLLILAGVVVGVAAALFLTGPSLPSAAAENPAPLPIGRYQISAYPAAGGGPTGAFVVDTATGEVFSLTVMDNPKSLGKVTK